MEYLIMVAIGIGGFILGAYSFNSFALPLFYTIPRFKKEKAKGNLVKPAPIVKLILIPLAAILIFGAVMYFSYAYYADYPWSLFIGLTIALIGVYSKIKSTKGEKEKDFQEDYGDYLRKK